MLQKRCDSEQNVSDFLGASSVSGAPFLRPKYFRALQLEFFLFGWGFADFVRRFVAGAFEGAPHVPTC
jgi:hypothetical protein